MLKFGFPRRYLFTFRDGESPDIPALIRNLGFQPSRITVRKKSVKVPDSLNEVSVTSVIFYR